MQPPLSVTAIRRGRATLDDWKNRLHKDGVSDENVDGVLGILAILFIPVREATEDGWLRGAEMEEFGKRGGIGHPDYFDRYFALSVPAEDIADSVVAEALSQLRKGTPGHEVDLVTNSLIVDTSRVTRKIRTQRDHESLPTGALLRLLGDIYGQLPLDSIFTARPHGEITLLACSLLGDLNEDAGLGTLRSLGATDAGTELAVKAIRALRHAESQNGVRGIPTLTWIDAAEDVMLQLIKARLGCAVSEPLTEISCSLFRELLAGWQDLDLSGVRNWLWEQIMSEEWSLVA